MNVDKWFSTKKNIKKSKKNYAHFDYRTDITNSYIRKYITNSQKVAHHVFYSFIKYTQKYGRYHKIDNNMPPEYDPKERQICYSAHIDRCIYQYYSAMLNEKYDEMLKRLNIYNIPVAYRTNLGVNNIKIFKEVCDFIRSTNHSYVMIGDFTDFFGKITNHI